MTDQATEAPATESLTEPGEGPTKPTGEEAGTDEPEGATPVEGDEPTKEIIRVDLAGRGMLEIDPRQRDLTPDQIVGFRAIGIEADPTNPDHVPLPNILLFLHICQKRRLDPALREIYLVTHGKIKRGSRGQVLEDKRKFTPIIGIDGFRKRGEAAGDYAGMEGPFWLNSNGEWHDHWLPDWGPTPVAAKVGIWRRGFQVPVWGVAHYDEYVPLLDEWVNGSKTGKKVPTDMWVKMPLNQTAKCAESAGWRKAYPDKFSGLYSEEEMDRARTEYENQRVEEDMAARRRLEAYTGGPIVQGAIAETPTTLSDAAQHVVADAAKVSLSPEERVAVLREEVEWQAAMFGQPVSEIVSRREGITEKPYAEWGEGELVAQVAMMRAGVAAILRREGDETGAAVYKASLEGRVVAPLRVLLGHDPVWPVVESVDPAQPHTYTDREGVCVVCEREPDDVIHEPGG